MRTVHKFLFVVEDEVKIEMPIGAKILKVEEQDGSPCMWALVDTKRMKHTRTFRVFGTGHPVEMVKHHIGTFLSKGGDRVWHVFE